jgi:very-short-patch-repair endonuclease/predicted transcriptional regulator of viral defense system
MAVRVDRPQIVGVAAKGVLRTDHQHMDSEITRLLNAHGVVTRDDVLAHVSRHVLDRFVSSRRLVPVQPKIYARPEQQERRDIRERAALLYAGSDAVLSHVSALRYWNLPVPDVSGAAIHVTVPRHVRRTSRPGIVIHRSLLSLDPLRRGGQPVTRLERSIVDSWTLLTGPDQRAPAIMATAERQTTPERLLAESLKHVNVKGRASLLSLCDALARGCRSELELWGLQHVFRSDRRLSHGVMQYPVALDSRMAYLDVAFVHERVAVELDGAAYHSGRVNRERDMRRDAALTALGWVVLRYSAWRLHQEPDAVRDEINAVLVTRRRQLAA